MPHTTPSIGEANPRRRRPDAAVDPATLTQQEYVDLQIKRSRLKADEDCSFRATHLLGELRDRIGGEAYARLDSILCVGCRNGRELDAAAAAGFGEVVGIDLHSLDRRILVRDMHDTGFAGRRFDVVLASHVFEHAKDPERAGAEFVRVARPGGYIIIEVPIFYGTFEADLWDFESAERVAAMLPGTEIVWADEGTQLDGPQEVARVIACVPASAGL